MQNKTNLTDSQRSLIAMCVRVAAEKFLLDEKMCREIDGTETPIQLENHSRLADQFRRQYDEASSLADSIDNADEVIVVVEAAEAA